MLPSRNRLKTDRDIARVMRTRPVVQMGGIALRRISSPFFGRPPLSRFAVVISKKVLKKATDRNRLRRRITNAITHLPGGRPSDTVLMIRSAELLRTSPQALAQLIARILH